jgi:hypothetical protein
MRGRRNVVQAIVVVAVALATAGASAGSVPRQHAPRAELSDAGWQVLSTPIDPRQQTALAFGERSYWLQPWRAYLDTQPAAMLRGALGINFNVPPSVANPVAKLLAASGFKRARIEIGWDSVSYANPGQLADPASFDALLTALKNNGIRPLILLNANDKDPGPSLRFQARVTAPAPAGATSIQVDPSTARQLVPGLSGLDVPGGPAAIFLVTSVSPTGTATLSQPLPVAIPAGTYAARTLRYAPFAPPLTASGTPNPAFEQTLAGWLAYVGAVTSEARRVLNGDDFDVEVWNELTFGSSFLDVANYYQPVPAALRGTGSVTGALLARTVQWLRDPAHGVSGIGIGDGFANQTPFVSGSTVPVGVTAIDKHPYHGVTQFPQDAGLPVYTQNGMQAVNALGQVDGTSANGSPGFTPTFRAFFPEYYLSGLQTEFMERDLSPITTTIGAVPHGRDTKPAGAGTPPEVWITETNIDPTGAGPLTAADKRHLQAKAALRILSSFVNKGVSALYFYAVTNGDFAMLDPTAPGGGETLTAIKRFMSAFAGPDTIAVRRALTLQAIADQGGWTQFAGDGTAAHPPLYNRDVVGFFPFQTDSNRFVVPVYVMTRDMATLYDPNAPDTDVTRYDLPPETYRLTIGGLHTASLSVSAIDPLTGQAVPATVVSTTTSTAVVQIALTDYPRLLVISDG